MSEMVVILGYERVDAAARDDVVAAFADMVRRGRAADGCLHFSVCADAVEPDRINTAEAWRDEAALEAWRAQAEPPELDAEIRDLQVKRYSARDGGPLF